MLPPVPHVIDHIHVFDLPPHKIRESMKRASGRPMNPDDTPMSKHDMNARGEGAEGPDGNRQIGFKRY